jgi:hypothetical protein
MTVDELLSRISSRELSEWQVYSQIEPWGETRADWRSGIVAAVIANVNRAKGQPAYSPETFIPRFGPQPEQGWEEQLAIVEMLNVAFGGKDMRHVNAG